MDKKVLELMKAIPKAKLAELTKLAAKAVSKEEILEIAKKEGIAITLEQAEAVLNAFSEAVSVKGEALDAVSGGCGSQC